MMARMGDDGDRVRRMASGGRGHGGGVVMGGWRGWMVSMMVVMVVVVRGGKGMVGRMDGVRAGVDRVRVGDRV